MRHTYQLSSRTGLHVCSCVVIPVYTPIKGLKLKLDTLWQLLTLRNSVDLAAEVLHQITAFDSCQNNVGKHWCESAA